MKTILVYKVLIVRFRINYAKRVILSVNGELRRKGTTAQRCKGLNVFKEI